MAWRDKLIKVYDLNNKAYSLSELEYYDKFRASEYSTFKECLVSADKKFVSTKYCFVDAKCCSCDSIKRMRMGTFKSKIKKENDYKCNRCKAEIKQNISKIDQELIEKIDLDFLIKQYVKEEKSLSYIVALVVEKNKEYSNKDLRSSIIRIFKKKNIHIRNFKEAKNTVESLRHLSYIGSKAKDGLNNRVANYLDTIGASYEREFVLGERIFDFKLNANVLLEINGKFWHCDPRVYEENFFNKRMKKTAKQVWDRDAEKIEIAKNLGYKVLTVWELDINKDINIVKEVINNGMEI